MKKCFFDYYMIYICCKVCVKKSKQRVIKCLIAGKQKNTQFVLVIRTNKNVIYRILSVNIFNKGLDSLVRKQSHTTVSHGINEDIEVALG